MGTTLTGTTPQDTYDSLIKVTDNGPLSGTLKALSDGLGNDSTLSLSTTAASIAGTLAVAGAATFDTSTLVVDAANNRVGIGTATPASILQLEKSSDSGSASIFPSLQVKNTLATQGDGSSTFNFSNLNLSSGDGAVNMFLLTTFAAGTWEPSAQLSVSSNHPLVFKTNNTERMRILADGNVGIGTSAPAVKLEVSGGDVRITSASAPRLSLNNTSGSGLNYSLFSNDIGKLVIGRTGITDDLIVTSAGPVELVYGQLKFPATQVASADANTLDDYEEGTFSPTIIGTTTAGTATYTQQNGRYTKIGRLVQFEIFIVYSAGTGTGNMDISGLPFTIGGSSYPSFTIGAFDDITLSADNYVLCWGLVGTNQMRLAQMITGGGTQTQVAYDAAGAIQITGTYSV
jgi:hypothetical protein